VPVVSHTEDRERRRFGRVDLQKQVMLVESNPAHVVHNAETVDVSALGVRVRGSTAGLRPRQRVDLIIKEETAQVMPSQVVWVAPGKNSRVGEAGLKFLSAAKLAYT
jgi:hypothetical protein